ncbi:DUF1272 domain-containing protein [Porticoccus sp. GXU_MW_L64]
MLKMKSECERCQKSLPPDSQEAMICSFEFGKAILVDFFKE